MSLEHTTETVLNSMENYLEEEKYKGWDPHDGLNSPFLSSFWKKNKIPSILFLQLIKRSHLNLRPILNIPKSYNPKGIALFLESYILKYKIFKDQESLTKAKFFAEWLINNYSKGYTNNCWGYPFDWANRKFIVPKWTPNIVVTVFCANALLNYYSLTKNKVYLDSVKSSCNFIIQDLYITKKMDSICFSYTPIDKTCIHNANMLGSSLLAKTGNISNNNEYKEYAIKSINFSAKSQRPDGSWYYGEDQSQKWIDSFHTGYNLMAFSSFIKAIDTPDFKNILTKGYDFYKKKFFLPDGTVKYYHNKIYPLDSHSFAHAIICLCQLSYLEDNHKLLKRIIQKLFSFFWSEKGYFYYKKNNFGTVKTPFMRWTQAWIFFALFSYLDYIRNHNQLIP